MIGIIGRISLVSSTQRKNKNMSKERYQVVRITVKISDPGRGLNQEDIDKVCRRLEKVALGRSKTRNVSAVC